MKMSTYRPTRFNRGSMGPKGKLLYATNPLRDWFYLVAQCDWDGDAAVNEESYQHGDMAEIGRDNEGR